MLSAIIAVPLCLKIITLIVLSVFRYDSVAFELFHSTALLRLQKYFKAHIFPIILSNSTTDFPDHFRAKVINSFSFQSYT